MEWHGGRIRAGQGGQRGGGRRTRRAGGGVEGEGAGVLTVPLVLTLLKKDMSAVIACSRQARRKKRGGRRTRGSCRVVGRRRGEYGKWGSASATATRGGQRYHVESDIMRIEYVYR